MTTSPEALRPVRPLRLLPALPAPLWLLLLALVCFGFWVLLPVVRGIPPWAAVVPASLLFAGLSMSLVAAGTLWPLPAWRELLFAGLCAGAWALGDRLAGPHAPGALYLRAGATVLFLFACLFLGRLLSRIVRERALTLPVCLVAGLADLFSVFFGPTGKALERAPAVVGKLSVTIPAAGSAAGPKGVAGLAHVASMGLGDFIFLALFLALAVRFGFSARRSFVAMAAGVWAGITLALLWRALPGVPLLPFMCAGYLAVNRRQFHLSPTERRDLAIGLVVLLGLFVLAALALRW